MTEESEENYRGIASVWLDAQDIPIWSKVTIKSKKGNFSGVLIPRGEQGDEKHIVIKLKNGYNIGLALDEIIEIKRTGEIEDVKTLPIQKIVKDPKKPTVVLIGTGGTVASKLDYKTGAVSPAFSTQELYNALPELREICNLETKSLFQKFSENIDPQDWITIANEIVHSIENVDPNGIVCSHGTDTLHYTSAALSFMLKNVDRPIVLTGSQRSSDRPSSDASTNLIKSASFAANSDIAEIVICMHGTSSDNYNLIHRGTRVRKMHSSRRDAFRTISDIPIAKIDEKNKISYTGVPYRKKKQTKVTLEIDTKIDEKVGLIYYHPGMKSDIIDYYIDKEYSGLIIAGTGLGHVNQKFTNPIERAVEMDMPIFMTTQCIWGSTGMNVYETGRLLLDAGIIPLKNILPEVALVKAMWVLGHTKEIPFVKQLMSENLAGEIIEAEPYNGFIVFQGGIDKKIDKIVSSNK